MEQEPATIQEAIIYFSKPAKCRDYLIARRWPNGGTCPKCGSADILFLENYSRWHCRQGHAAPQFTLKTGTVMEDSPIGLDKWLTAAWQIANRKSGVSSCEIARAIGVTQKCAWFMGHGIRRRTFGIGVSLSYCWVCISTLARTRRVLLYGFLLGECTAFN
jgi:hypothetical protein